MSNKPSSEKETLSQPTVSDTSADVSSDTSAKIDATDNDKDKISIFTQVLTGILKSSSYCAMFAVICFIMSISSGISSYMWNMKMDHNTTYTWTDAELPRMFGFIVATLSACDLGLHIISTSQQYMEIICMGILIIGVRCSMLNISMFLDDNENSLWRVNLILFGLCFVHMVNFVTQTKYTKKLYELIKTVSTIFIIGKINNFHNFHTFSYSMIAFPSAVVAMDKWDNEEDKDNKKNEDNNELYIPSILQKIMNYANNIHQKIFIPLYLDKIITSGFITSFPLYICDTLMMIIGGWFMYKSYVLYNAKTHIE